MSHPCRVATCTRPAKDQQLMCWPHWRGLPRRLKDAIFETYRAVWLIRCAGEKVATSEGGGTA